VVEGRAGADKLASKGQEMRSRAAAAVLPLGFAVALISSADAQVYYPSQPREYSRFYEPQPGWNRHPGANPWGRLFEEGRSRAPALRVESPQYYAYQPDKPKTVSLAPLARAETASKESLMKRYQAGSFLQARAHLETLSLRALEDVGSAILAHYAAHPDFLWVKDGRGNDKAAQAIKILDTGEEFGLSSADYGVQPIANRVNNGEDLSSALISFEMQLSSAVLTYILDATRGRVDPNRISGYHDLPRHKVDLAEALRTIAGTNDVAKFLRERHPDNAQFKALTAELARLRSQGRSAEPKISATTSIRPGEANPQLPQIIAAIRAAGSNELKRKHAAVLEKYDGRREYGAALVAVVRDFQRERRLNPDGVIGRTTIATLMPASNNDDRIQKIEIALEQLRWLPRDLGQRYVLVNQPAFVAEYVENGRSVFSTRAVVGKKETQTYFFADRIEHVEYNPNWNVPHSILVNQMVPRLLSDPSYLSRKGYEVINAAGKKVSSASVDWHRVATKKLAVNVRQPPGDANALGTLKIMFPNNHSIYMHDTPQKELFAKPSRAFSNGCIRLEDASGMAAALLGKGVDHVSSRISTGKTSSDRVADDLPVYVAYFTAWPSGDGKVGYFDDVYERDTAVANAIQATNFARRQGG
jgi:L,D-transpeptidase YcbB